MYLHTFTLIDFAIVKAKYHEIIACLPENHEAMIASLLNHLSDSQICDILSLTAGQAQKILNCLILRLKSKEDLLDFCDSLEKVPEAPGSLKDLIVQLRKGTELQNICTCVAPYIIAIDIYVCNYIFYILIICDLHVHAYCIMHSVILLRICTGGCHY